MKIGKATLAGDTHPLRVGFSLKVYSFKFSSNMGGQVVTCCFKSRCNNYKILKFILQLAVLDAFIAISEDLNLKFSQENMSPDPHSLLTLTRSH